MKKERHLFSKIYLVAIIIFFYLPILYTILFSFNSSKSLSAFAGFSLRWYEKMFSNSNMTNSIYYTISIAIIATVVSTIFGTITAIGLSKSGKAMRSAVSQMTDLPIMNPDIVTGIGLLMLFSSLAIEKGYITMLLSHIMFCTPFVILSIMPKLRGLDPNLLDAALDLGCTPMTALRKVIIPQITSGIFAGALIAFTMSFDDFVISYFVTGNGISNISIMVYTMSKRVNPTINALSTVVILLITIVLILLNLIPVIKRKLGNKFKGFAMVSIPVVILCAVFFITSGIGLISDDGSDVEETVSGYEGQTLKLYNWGEYIGENVISDFESKYGVKVINEFFDSNEMMYTKLLAGDKYDILVPSDYMIERLLKEDMLQPLDKSKIPNLANLTDGVKNLDYDKDNTYSAPYFWGTVGLVYNTENVDPNEIEAKGWDILKDTKYKGNIYIYDSERDAFMVALKALGYSMNTESEDEINAAYDWLLEVNNTMAPSYVTDEVIDSMVNGNKDIAVVYSGDAAYILNENSDMDYCIPSVGTNLWSDAMVIPKNADNPALANEFINFILDYAASEDNSLTVGYTSSNDEVMINLSEVDFAENAAYIPRTDNENDEIFHDNETLRKKLSELWTSIKAQ